MDFWSLRPLTHTHVIGGTRKGKSSFLEWLIRGDVERYQPFALLDWHGTLYRAVISHLASLWFEREVIALDLSEPRYILPLDFFSSKGDLGTRASNNISAFIRPFGLQNTNEMPTFERLTRMLFTFMAETGETLPNASLLLDPAAHGLRDSALTRLTDEGARQTLAEMSTWTPKEFREQTLSTRNKLSRFLGSLTVKRFLGLKHGLDLEVAVNRGAIILVNLARPLDRISAAIFASLFLKEFFEIAMRRAGSPDLYTLYLDEFQAYITSDIAASLDEALKGGLHLVLAHQHLTQGLDSHLKESILTNARMRVAFGGLSYPTAAEVVQEMFLPEVNQRDIKATYYKTRERLDRYREFMDRVSETEGPDDYKSKTTSHDFRDVLIPEEVEELSFESDWTREEKVSRSAERLISQPQRYCFVKLDTEPTFQWQVPLLEDPGHSPEYVASFEEWLSESQGAYSPAVADYLLEQSAAEFRVEPEEPTSTGKRAKKPKK